MYIRLYCGGKLKIDRCVHVLDIEPTRRHVGTYQQPHFTRAQRSEGLFPVDLVQIAMQRCVLDVVTAEAPRQTADGFCGVYKHHYARMLPGLSVGCAGGGGGGGGG
mmetsp:Transcript_28863/g.47846  ORF Transcript_28863/g.47846 Transcript_28863/m.47846 type:complete len:106 (+) Transcript_28863:735-1052(+)